MFPVLSYAIAYTEYVPVPGESLHETSYLLGAMGTSVLVRPIRCVPSSPSFVYRISTSSMPLASLAVIFAVKGNDVEFTVEPFVGVWRVTLGALPSGLIMNVRWARPMRLFSVIARTSSVFRPEKFLSNENDAVCVPSGPFLAISLPSRRKRTSRKRSFDSTSTRTVTGLFFTTVVFGSTIFTCGRSSSLPILHSGTGSDFV